MATATRTRLEPDLRRREILTAARGVFSSRDYAAASMEDVALEAGVTRGLVNHYFGTKRRLYLAVVADLAAELPKIVRTDLHDLPIEGVVERNLTRFLDAVERDYVLWSILLGSGAAGRDPEVAAIVVSARDEVVERMARNHAGENADEELRLALRAFLGAAIAAAEEWLVRGRATRAQVEALLRRALLAMAGSAQQA
jgi:AcrR family transcriptional regulator